MDWIHTGLPVLGAVAITWALVRTSFDRVRREQDLERTQVADSARREASESEQRLRMVLESLPSALLMFDQRGLVLFANPQADRTFGHEPGALLGRDVSELLPTREWAEMPGWTVANDSHGLPPEDLMLTGRRANGEEFPALFRMRVAETPQGRFGLAFVADLSTQREMEREREQQREELTHLARVGTLAELSGSMAHELNQPLTAILSNAQAAQRFLAQDPPNLDEVRASIADIIVDDKRAGEIIRRLRGMLKKQAPDYQSIDVNLLVTEVLRLARSDLLNRRVRVVTELQPGLPAVRADLVQLQQVFINLLLNAGDAMADEPEPHEIAVSTLATSTGLVEVRLRDNGIGIAEPDLERIFDPFVTSKREGIGLGLAVCRSIILDHGGKLWATNNLGRGATLHVALPRVDPAS